MTGGEGRAVAYVAVGSNVRPERNVPAALRLLARKVEVLAVSTFYRTAPLSRPDQPYFLNGVLAVRTAGGSRMLKFDVLRPIEAELGRRRAADRDAARTIDLDVVLYGDRVVDEPDLKIPAPDIDRPFVAVPLLELAPDLVLPHTCQALSCLWSGRGTCGMTADPDCTKAVREAWKP